MEHRESPRPKKPGKQLKVERGTGDQAKKVVARLNGFDAENCVAIRELRATFSAAFTNEELRSIARLLCEKFPGQLKLDWDARRDGRVLIKRYQENWATISPVLQNIELRDDDGHVITTGTDAAGTK
jgi:hypothetical protein